MLALRASGKNKLTVLCVSGDVLMDQSSPAAECKEDVEVQRVQLVCTECLLTTGSPHNSEKSQLLRNHTPQSNWDNLYTDID